MAVKFFDEIPKNPPGIREGHLYWNRERIMEVLLKFHEVHGRWPKESDFRGYRPGANTIRNKFGSLRIAVKMAQEHLKGLRREDS